MRRGGQVALETIAVLFVYLLVLFLFVGSIFALSGRIIAQGALNQAVREVAVFGCLPSFTDEADPESKSLAVSYNTLLAEEIEVFGNVIDDPESDISWTYNNSNDDIPELESIPTCERVFRNEGITPDPVPSDRIITARVEYEQLVPALAFLLGASSISMTLQSSMVSSSLEDRG